MAQAMEVVVLWTRTVSVLRARWPRKRTLGDDQVFNRMLVSAKHHRWIVSLKRRVGLRKKTDIESLGLDVLFLLEILP